MKYELFNEQELVNRLRENDPFAFRILYEKHAPRLMAFCFRFKFSKEESEEIVQEAFIKIWQNRNSIDPNKSFNTFLITIGKHLIYNQIRHNKYRSDYLHEVNSELNASVVDLSNEGELQKIVNKAMMELPDKCRAVFRKSRMEGYSNQQIANEMNISKSTVENQLNKALKKIRSYVLKHGYKPLKVLLLFGGIKHIFLF